jgi:hypothetical protein
MNMDRNKLNQGKGDEIIKKLKRGEIIKKLY